MTPASSPAAHWRTVRWVLAVAAIILIAWVVATREGDAPPSGDFQITSAASPATRPGPVLVGSPHASELQASRAISATSSSAQRPTRGPVRVFVRKPGTGSVALRVQLDGQPAQDEVWTSAEGQTEYTEFDDLPYDGSATVVVAAPRHRSGVLVSGVVRGPEVLLETAETPISCDIRAVDIESGGDVPGAKMLGRGSLGSLPLSERLVTWERDQVFRPFVSAPEGWTLQPVHELAYWLSLRATRVRIDVPMSREADVVVEAGEGGTRGYGALRVVQTLVAAAPRAELRTEGAGRDRVRIRGIPWLPGEPIRVLAAAGPPRDAEGPEVEEVTEEEPSEDERLWGDSTWPTSIEEDHVMEPGRFAIGRARLARTRADTTRLVATFGRVTPIGRTIETDNDLAYEESLGAAAGTSHPLGVIEATVFDRAGERIPFARLLCEGVHRFTDADGTCRFADVRVGTRQVALVEPGWVRTEASAEVQEGETTQVELREGLGGRILLRVIDDLGHPLPAADIQAPSEAAWADLDADFVQRLDTRTDHRGECLLQSFPAGTWELWVLWASRSKRARVTVVEGQTSEIQVTLPAPADPQDAPK